MNSKFAQFKKSIKRPSVEIIDKIGEHGWPTFVLLRAHSGAAAAWSYYIRTTTGTKANVPFAKCYECWDFYASDRKMADEMLKLRAAKEKLCRVEVFSVEEPVRN